MERPGRRRAITSARRRRPGRSPMRRPRLKPSTEVLPADGSLYLVRGSGETLRLDDCAETRALLASLDGTRAEPELVAAAGQTELEADAVARFVAELAELGVVDDKADDDRLGGSACTRLDRQLRYFSELAPAGRPASGCQERVAGARVAVLGLGGLGSWVAHHLASCGVGQIVGVDGDRVELGNLHRQVLYGERDIGRQKALAAERAIAELNSEVDFVAVPRLLSSAADVGEAIEGADVVVDAVDWPPHEIERWISAACLEKGIPYIAMSQFPPLARIGPFYVPGKTGCYRCQETSYARDYALYAELAAARSLVRSPAAAFGPACGLIGSLVATEVVHFISGLCPPATLGKALLIDMRTLATETHDVPRLEDCPACGRGYPRRDEVTRGEHHTPRPAHHLAGGG